MQKDHSVTAGDHTTGPSEGGGIFLLPGYQQWENSSLSLSVANSVSRASITVLAGPATELQPNPQFLFLAASSSQSSSSQWSGCSPSPKESFTLSGLLLKLLNDFACCREICHPTQSPAYGGRLACNGILLCISWAPFTTLLHQCYADLGTIAHTLS
jgi:hypothetical protein